MEDSLPRGLTPRERDALIAMIRHAPPSPTDQVAVSEADRQRWLGQVPSLQVVRTCACGMCPTIEFVLDDDLGPGIYLEAEAAAGGLGLLLMILGDQVAFFEGFTYEDDDAWHEFPPADQIEFW